MAFLYQEKPLTVFSRPYCLRIILAAQSRYGLKTIRWHNTRLVRYKFTDRVGNDMGIAHIPHILPRAFHSLPLCQTCEHFAPLAKLLLLLLIQFDDSVAKAAVYLTILILIINVCN
jgi:hypothetical protein